MQHKRRPPQGIEVREWKHVTTYRASVWSTRDGRLIRKRFDSLAEAKAWRTDAMAALQHGTLRPPARVTIEESAEAWLEDARNGVVRNRSGRIFKPSTIRSYERALKLRVYPALGSSR